VFVLAGARYVEQFRHNTPVQSFLSGVSAAVVGVIVLVSLELAPEVLIGLPSSRLEMSKFEAGRSRCAAG
jgi:chromate transport protein ChrA